MVTGENPLGWPLRRTMARSGMVKMESWDWVEGVFSRDKTKSSDSESEAPNWRLTTVWSFSLSVTSVSQEAAPLAGDRTRRCFPGASRSFSRGVVPSCWPSRITVDSGEEVTFKPEFFWDRKGMEQPERKRAKMAGRRMRFMADLVYHWRRVPELNRRIAVLQTAALPLRQRAMHLYFNRG
ncbi:MAG: hypothetical protein UV02_C0062G0001, partial [Candidatus Kuenenbacteria bacterium GW2011_GWA2_42_15]